MEPPSSTFLWPGKSDEEEDFSHSDSREEWIPEEYAGYIVSFVELSQFKIIDCWVYYYLFHFGISNFLDYIAGFVNLTIV